MLVVYRSGPIFLRLELTARLSLSSCRSKAAPCLVFGYFFRWVSFAAHDFGVGHYALYQRLDHSSVADGRRPSSLQVGERGGTRPEENYSVYAVRYDRHCGHSRFWDRRRARANESRCVVMSAGWGFRLMTVITLTAGTGFLMWLGEQITSGVLGTEFH